MTEIDAQAGKLARRSDFLPQAFTQETVIHTQQLAQVTKLYLKDHRLLVSFANLKLVEPVIRSCITDGLSEMIRQDDIVTAFKLGYKKRQQTIDLFSKATKSSRDVIGSFRGHLALPEALILAGRDQIGNRKHITSPDLGQARKLVELAHIRQQTFKKLSKRAEQEVQKQIPNSKNITLTQDQQAGLVRNMIFSFITSGKLQPLLEMEDIISKSADFKEDLEVNPTEVLSELMSALGLTEGTDRTYLSDLTGQLIEILGSVSKHSLTYLEGTSKAYEHLVPFFTIVDPFYKLVQISENPDDPDSLWSDKHSQILTIGGRKYRVPRISSLRALAFQKRSTDINHSHQIRAAISTIETLTTDNNLAPIRNSIKAKEDRIKILKEEVETFRTSVREGQVPTELLLTPAQVINLGRGQLDIIADEIAALPLIKNFIDRKRARVIELLYHYQDGRIAVTPGQMQEIRRLFLSPRLGVGRLNRLMSERIIERFRAFEYLYAAEAGHNRYEVTGQPNLLSIQFDRAYQTTLIDLLEHTSQRYLRDFIYDTEGPDNKELKCFWESYLKSCRDSLEKDLVDTARAILGGNKTDQILSDYEYVIDSITNPRVASLIEISHGNLRPRLEQYLKIKLTLDKGEWPDLMEIRGRPYILKSSINDFRKRALRAWKTKTKMSQPIESLIVTKPKYDLTETDEGIYDEEDLTYVELGTKLQKDEYIAEFNQRLQRSFGPAGVLLNILIRLPDSYFWDNRYKSLMEMVNHSDKKLIDIQFRRHSDPDAVDEFRTFRERVFNYLQNELKLPWDEKFIARLIDSQALTQGQLNAHHIKNLYTHEREVMDWYRFQTEKVKKQIADPPQILVKDPIEVFLKKKSLLDRTAFSLGNINATRSQITQNLINQIGAAGLIKQIKND